MNSTIPTPGPSPQPGITPLELFFFIFMSIFNIMIFSAIVTLARVPFQFQKPVKKGVLPRRTIEDEEALLQVVLGDENENEGRRE